MPCFGHVLKGEPVFHTVFFVAADEQLARHAIELQDASIPANIWNSLKS